MISNIFSAATCAACFLYTFYVLCNFTYFLSHHNNNLMSDSLKHDSWLGDNNEKFPILWPLLIDMCLLSIFMLQHSVMAKDFVNALFKRLHVEFLSRSIYNSASAAILHMLLCNWQFVPSLVIWRIDTSSSLSLWLFFTGLHTLAWIIIYSGCLMMDISDLVGLKQVYYKMSGKPDPGVMKSRELLRYYSHMRHPSFTGFLIILWLHPFMTIDRVLMAFELTIYMAMMWTVDKADYNYHANLVRIKEIEIF